jgi:hypothetical protein
LSTRRPLGIALAIATIMGMLAGGYVGHTVLVQVYGNNLTRLAEIIGLVSTSILGGLGAFLCWGLLHVAISAWWQAQSRAAGERIPDKE